MDQMINVLEKKPNEVWKRRQIENELEALQQAVGGYIETVTLDEDVVVICDEEGLIKEYEYNCEVNGVDFVGTILLCGISGEEFADVPEDIAAYLLDRDETFVGYWI